MKPSQIWGGFFDIGLLHIFDLKAKTEVLNKYEL